VAGAFFVLFPGVFEGGFGKCAFFGGVFVVNCWRIRGEWWSIGDRSVVAKNVPLF
jgi:hypothetical protein